LRRLNQRKEDYLSILNRLKEKNDPLKLPFGHDKWHGSNGITLGKKATSPKKRQERRSTCLGYIFPPPDNSNRERKILNPKAIITYKRPTTIGQFLTNYKHLALK